MFYYAVINDEYLVTNVYSSTEVSTNPNHISITQELYDNGNDNGALIGQYYNVLLNVFEIVDIDWEIGRSEWVTHKATKMPLSTKLDNTEVIIANKADINHTHSVATTSANGFMSSTDKSKLNGIAAGANAYTHPTYTARTGVPIANATLTHGGTFTVTQPICDATGHITAMNTRTYTLPTDNNTDTKVTNTLATTTKAYVTGTTSATTNTGTQVFDTGVYLDTTAGKLTATTFNGTTFSGSGVATVSEVETYLGI